MICLSVFWLTFAIPIYSPPFDQASRLTRYLLQENQKATEHAYISYRNKRFVVFPNVISPKMFPDAYFFADTIDVRPGSSFLHIGSGTGLIAIAAALKGASRVTAVDSYPEAVNNTAENAFLHRLSHQFRVYEGNLFDPIPRGQRFDVIFWNAPFISSDEERGKMTHQEQAFFDPSYQTISRYLKDAQHYLTPRGRLLLGFSSSHGDMKTLKTMAAENGWEVVILAEEQKYFPWLPCIQEISPMTVTLIELHPCVQGM